MIDHTKRVAIAIVNTFETGKQDGDYGAVVVLDDGAGFSVGRSQATDGGGTLDAVLARYAELTPEPKTDAGPADPAWYARFVLAPLLKADSSRALPSTKKGIPAGLPQWAKDAIAWFQKMGDDPTWRQAQDDVFERGYWLPALARANYLGLALPLSIAAVYDTEIQSGAKGLQRIRALFPEVPPYKGGDEKAWTLAYLKARRAWLAGHARADVRASVYRMDAFLGWAVAGLWHLPTPLTVPKPKAVIS